jgi:hypothetical protein
MPMQGDNDEGTPAEARRMADQFVAMIQRKSGATLDYSPKSLTAVDLVVDQIKGTGTTADQASGMIYAIGCYVGEVFVQHAQGSWRSTAEMGMTKVCSWPLVIALPNGTGLNPIGKAFKRFNNGPGDSLAFFYAASLRLPQQ